MYPYSTVGALFWTDPADNSNWFCSASVLRLRVVATAGHCVASPATSTTRAHFHTNFLFIPGWRNGAAPFGTFTWRWATTTATWFYGNGSVPNAQDVGLIVMNDRNGYKLGQYTGYLGYWTNQLSNNNVTMLGFPCNLDGCELLEANYAQTFEYGGNNTYIFGSNFGGGSSGGPYIRDFGRAPSGSLTSEGGNWLVAVNSYGPINLGYLYSGASNLNNEFLTLVTNACNAAGAGGC
jgi:V8-like Glu-specific endopeptidase